MSIRLCNWSSGATFVTGMGAESGMNQVAKAERVSARAIAGFIEEALVKTGLPAADAGKVAELMCEADLTGADAHGIFRLPQYVKRLRAGGINPRPAITV